MRKTFPVKRLADGRALLNLGSSARVAPGWNNIDRYRHGRYPRVRSDGLLDDKDPHAQVKVNILYGDGHVSTALDMNEVYRSFQVREP